MKLTKASETITIAVILDQGDCVDTELIDVPANASDEDIRNAIIEARDLDPEDGFTEENVQWFKLDPACAERLKKIEWPDPYKVDAVWADAVAAENGVRQALVYSQFAADGPAELTLDYFKGEEEEDE